MSTVVVGGAKPGYVSAYVSEATAAELRRVAAANYRSASAELRLALERHLERQASDERTGAGDTRAA